MRTRLALAGTVLLVGLLLIGPLLTRKEKYYTNWGEVVSIDEHNPTVKGMVLPSTGRHSVVITLSDRHLARNLRLRVTERTRILGVDGKPIEPLALKARDYVVADYVVRAAGQQVAKRIALLTPFHKRLERQGAKRFGRRPFSRALERSPGRAKRSQKSPATAEGGGGKH